MNPLDKALGHWSLRMGVWEDYTAPSILWGINAGSCLSAAFPWGAGRVF